MFFLNSDIDFAGNRYPEIYDCRENCRMAVYTDTNIGETEDRIETLCKNGFSVIRRNEIAGNKFFLLEKDGMHITAYFTPCDSTLRVTAGENPVPYCGEPCCEGDGETVFYAFENDHTYID